jgi:hypothetical protein
LAETQSSWDKFLEPDRIRKAMDRAVRRAVWEHVRLGYPVVTMRDGKPYWLRPEEVHIETPEDIIALSKLDLNGTNP